MTEQRGLVRTEPSHKRVRILLGGAVIVDTDDALYVWEKPYYPQYYVPIGNVVDGTLKPSGTESRSPSRGTATHYTVLGGGKEAIDGAWAYLDSPIEALHDRVRFDWDAMDAWFEEDEEIFVHPRDPATRVQILPSSRHVTVAIDGVVVAETTRPTFLYETGLPRRTYLPKLDVRMDLLVPTDTQTGCPYKGRAHYWSLVTPQGEHTDIAWSYPNAAARVGRHRRPHGLLRRARRPHSRRRAAATTCALGVSGLRAASRPAREETAMDVTLQYFDGCPNWQTADARLRALADELGFRISYRKVATPEEAEALSFHGSPTVLVDGADPFPAEGAPGLACRIYQTPVGPAGTPTVEQLRAVLTTGREGRL